MAEMEHHQEPGNNIKTWPFFVMMFVQTSYFAIFGLAFKNFLIFDRQLNPNDVGNIVSALPIAYIFGPFFCAFVTNRIKGGVRSSLILSAIASTLLHGLQLIFTDPGMLITIRVCLGFIMGLSMPNTLILLSKWQKISSPEKAVKNFKNLNNATYAGFTLGFLIGFVLSFVASNEFLVLITAVIISSIAIPLSFMIEKTPKLPSTINDKDGKSNTENRKKAELSIIFPILLSWVGTFFVIASKAFINFTYPYFYFGNRDESWISFIYLANIFQYIGQIWSVNYIASKQIPFKRNSFLIAITAIFLLNLVIIWNHQTWLISLFISMAGIFFGLIIGISQKIMIDYGSMTGSSMYSIINEVLIGVSFGVIPMISGYIIAPDLWTGITLIFIILSIFSLLTLISSIFITRNINKTN